MTNHPPLISDLADNVIRPREIEDELGPIPGVDYPHVFAIVSWYDTQLFADEVLDAFNVVAPPTDDAPDGYPAKRILLTTGGHSTAPWHAADEESYRDAQRFDWLHTFLYPFGTPLELKPFDYVQDKYVAGLPDFTRLMAGSWPITATDTISLYLHANGQALTSPPGLTGGSDELSQDFNPPVGGYTMAMAVDEEPFFANATTYIDESPLMYRSPALCQVVTLVSAPRVELHASSLNLNYQLHIRVHEENTGGNALFVTAANACAWSTPAPPLHFQGHPFFGESRVHVFQAGSRIALQFSPIDLEVYNASDNTMSMTLYLGDFDATVYHHGRPGELTAQDTNVRLSLVRSNTAYSGIFVGDLDCPPGGSSGPEGMASASAPEPGPLAMTAELYSDVTNPGDWMAWGPEVLITCTGGEGVVTCPTSPQFILTDGVSQTVSYTATDASGTVVTATLTGVTVDRTPPEVIIDVPEVPAACADISFLIDYTISDALSGVASSGATFNGQAVNVGHTVWLLPGANVLNVETQDVAGNVVTEEASIECDG